MTEEVTKVGSAEAIRALIGPALTANGLELWDVETGRGMVRVLVDAPGGIDLDTLSDANRLISSLLDDHSDLTPEGSYQLEVSSPGVERPLRTPEHFQRYVGSEVTVKTAELVEGSRRHRGQLLSAGDEHIELQPSEQPGGAPVRIFFRQIDRARTVLVWGPTPAPASRRRTARPPVNASATQAALDPKDTGS